MTIFQMIGLTKDKVVSKVAEWKEKYNPDWDLIGPIIGTIFLMVGGLVMGILLIYDNTAIPEWKIFDGQVSGSVYHEAHTSHSIYYPAYYEITAEGMINKTIYYVEREEETSEQIGKTVELKYGFCPISHSIIVKWR